MSRTDNGGRAVWWAVIGTVGVFAILLLFARDKLAMAPVLAAAAWVPVVTRSDGRRRLWLALLLAAAVILAAAAIAAWQP